MKKIKQFVFYGDYIRKNTSKKCIPEDMEKWETNLLEKYGPISHLGIQGEPGVIFYLNNSGDPISIGATGIYEMNLEGIGHISSIRFDMSTLSEKYDTAPSTLQRLLVDIVYEGV